MVQRFIGLVLATVVLATTIFLGQNYLLASSEERLQPTSNDTDLIAVVYFSATDVTANLAKRMGLMLGTVIFEIDPKQAYSREDLAYRDMKSRVNREKNNPRSRPAIVSEFRLDAYQKILLGYPVWRGISPRIIQTFIETYRLHNKTVYLFCTSGSSDGIRSFRNLQNIYPKVNFIFGKCFNSPPTDQELRDFLQIVK